MNPTPKSVADLLDWKRRIFGLYADVRSTKEPEALWRRWRAERDVMFRSHPQSPLPTDGRSGFSALNYFDYDPDARVFGRIDSAETSRYEIATSGEGTYSFTRFATAHFSFGDEALTLEMYWLEGYGGGLFLPFADATSGAETYGAGRYLFDTVKGADLGYEGDRIVLDFNFAYNPSCCYDPQWVCPLAPPPNRLQIPVRAGEKSFDH